LSAVESKQQIVFNRRDSGVALLLLDCPGKLNSLGTPVMNEMMQALQQVQSDPGIKALVMMSGKPDTFIIGADLFEIRKATTEAQLLDLAQRGQQLLNMVANFPKPVVVAINGECLGGGLELALSAHWRVMSDARITRLGLPETRLGIIPGLGGTQRLPRLVGLKQALAMILGAEPISVQQAAEIGLADEVVPPGNLMTAAEQAALKLAADPAIVEQRRRLIGTGTTADTTSWPLKDVDQEKANKLFAMTERSVRIKTRGNYPAQSRVIEVIKTGLLEGIDKGLQLEAQTFAQLASSDTAANLIALFFQTDFARQSAASLAAKFCDKPTQTVGIIGGGLMGRSIAQLSAQHEINSLIKVRAGRAQDVCEELSAEHVRCIENYDELSSTELVLESIIEDLEEKRHVLESAEKFVNDDCVIASNTSSLSLTDLATAVKKNDRFIGLHFFHPVDKMPLVEIVSLKTTSRKAVARAADYVTRLGKIPVMVKDGPGFLIDRLLTCYLLEAARLLEQRTPLNWVEESAVDFGMPMGPFELLDEVGLDLAYTVARSLYEEFGERMKPPAILDNIPRLGLVGKKNGVGVYLYDEGGRRKEINPSVAAIPEIAISDQKPDESTRLKIVHQLILPMIDEAARCLSERIVMKPREIDMAIVYGIGFPPFRGGLLRYADHIGVPAVVSQLNELYSSNGGAQQVSEMLSKYAEEGRGFYSRGGKEED
jgi:3-hydroxyacyl-CoA dehydrogenase/enoyl-CoA hydratase/3-hydroxybutyryl-CoA epimerase